MQFLNYYSKFLLYFSPTNSTKVKFENIHIKYLKSCNFCGFPVHGEYNKSPPYSNVFGMFLVELTSQSILLWHSKSHKHTTSGGGLGWVRVDGWEGTRPPPTGTNRLINSLTVSLLLPPCHRPITIPQGGGFSSSHLLESTVLRTLCDYISSYIPSFCFPGFIHQSYHERLL